MNEMNKESLFRYYFILNLLLLVYSFAGVCSKMAGRYSDAFFLFVKELFVSGTPGDFSAEALHFVLFFCGVFLILGVYAIGWQQLLKHISLMTAFCNKSVTIIWGMIWGVVFFSETIRWNMVLGALIVTVGVILVVKADE